MKFLWHFDLFVTQNHMGLVTYFKPLLKTNRFHSILAKLDDKYLGIGGGGGGGNGCYISWRPAKCYNTLTF